MGVHRPAKIAVVASWALLGVCCGISAAAPADPPPPNVLVILLDDVGLDQLALYDDQNQYPATDPYEYASTPNLDALAQGGVRFTQARANPVCSPTRALINAGRYAFRTGVGSIVRPEDSSLEFVEFSLPPASDELLLPETPELAGHEAAWIGKWHLGLEESDGGSGDLHPERVGWVHFAGVMRNLNQQPNPGPIKIGGHVLGPGYNHWYRVIDGQRLVETTYATTQQRIDCRNWILSQNGDPWCAVLAFSACHSPYDWPPDGTHNMGSFWPLGTGILWDHYRAMLESVDHEIGELLYGIGSALDNTIVIVLGDNGSPSAVLESARAEGQDLGLYNLVVDENRMKGSTYEPGIRVPLIIAGPGVKQPGRSSGELVDAVDLHATIRELAASSRFSSDSGLTTKDSRSLVRLLRDPNALGARHFSLAERFSPNGAWPADGDADRSFLGAVLGDGSMYKLVRRVGEADEVYDVTNDPLELVDLGTSHPAYRALTARLLGLVGR